MAKMLKSETEYTSDTGTDSTVIPSPDEPALKHVKTILTILLTL